MNNIIEIKPSSRNHTYSSFSILTQPVYGNISQGVQKCNHELEARPPRFEELCVILGYLRDNPNKKETQQLRESYLNSGHFLSATHVLKVNTPKGQRWFSRYLSNSQGPPHPTSMSQKESVSTNIESEPYFVEQLVKNRHDTFENDRVASALNELTKGKFPQKRLIQYRTPISEPEQIEYHTIMSVQSSLEKIFVSSLTSTHTTGITIPILLR